jgi:hypothetical protein
MTGGTPDGRHPTAEPSPTERRIGRVVVPEPPGFRPEARIDWIHDVDLEHLLEPQDRRR